MKNETLLLICWFVTCHLSISTSIGQVPVSEDPNHKIIFENKYVRLLDGHIRPHDTTGFHRHSANSIIVFLTKSVFGIGISGEHPSITSVNPGDIKYAAYGDRSVTHRVWNQGDSMFHFVVVEILRQYPGNDTCVALIQPGIRITWQQKSMRVYDVDAAEGKLINLSASTCAFLLINISGIITAEHAGVTSRLQSGDFVFYPPQSQILINGNKNENGRCILLEWR
ncbi:MAG TPA: hypothetical protein VKR53_20465 [Puia sp.]|nr:hypothetical protein [Puia sp.]